MSSQDDPLIRIAAALSAWRQGDYVLAEQSIFVRIDPEQPLGDDARALVAALRAAHDNEQLDILREQPMEARVMGLMITSQTCDVVRDPLKRPYVEVCPLVHVTDPKVLQSIRLGNSPIYAVIPALQGQDIYADLERTMTVEKAIVASWDRQQGCQDDEQARRLAQTLARKRERFAFPDDLNELLRPLQGRLTSKHDKDSPEGRALRSLRELRIHAAPGWLDPPTPLTLRLYFILDEPADAAAYALAEQHRKTWMGLLMKGAPQDGAPFSLERFTFVSEVTTLSKLSAAAYIASDRLDLDHLSR